MATAAIRPLDPAQMQNVRIVHATSPSFALPEHDYRGRIVRFYQRYNPEKIKEVDDLMVRYRDSLPGVIEAMKQKYGLEPGPVIAGAMPGPRPASAPLVPPIKIVHGQTPSSSGLSSPLRVMQPTVTSNLSSPMRVVHTSSPSAPASVILGSTPAKIVHTASLSGVIPTKIVHSASPSTLVVPPHGAVKVVHGGSPSTLPLAETDYRGRIFRYYQKYNPDKLKEVDEMLAKYKDDLPGVMTALKQKYGPEPGPLFASAPPAIIHKQMLSHSQVAPLSPAQLANPKIVVHPSPVVALPEGDFRARIARFYQRYAPEKLGEVNDIVERYKDNLPGVITAMKQKYGPEPGPVIAAPAQRAPPTPVNKSVIVVHAPALLETDFRGRIERFYQRYNPEKLSEVDEVVEKYKNDLPGVIAAMVQKYGPEPGPVRPAQATTASSPSSTAPLADLGTRRGIPGLRSNLRVESSDDEEDSPPKRTSPLPALLPLTPLPPTSPLVAPSSPKLDTDVRRSTTSTPTIIDRQVDDTNDSRMTTPLPSVPQTPAAVALEARDSTSGAFALHKSPEPPTPKLDRLPTPSPKLQVPVRTSSPTAGPRPITAGKAKATSPPRVRTPIATEQQRTESTENKAHVRSPQGVRDHSRKSAAAHDTRPHTPANEQRQPSTARSQPKAPTVSQPKLVKDFRRGSAPLPLAPISGRSAFERRKSYGGNVRSASVSRRSKSADAWVSPFLEIKRQEDDHQSRRRLRAMSSTRSRSMVSDDGGYRTPETQRRKDVFTPSTIDFYAESEDGSPAKLRAVLAEVAELTFKPNIAHPPPLRTVLGVPKEQLRCAVNLGSRADRHSYLPRVDGDNGTAVLLAQPSHDEQSSFTRLMVPYAQFSCFEIKNPARMSSWAMAPNPRQETKEVDALARVIAQRAREDKPVTAEDVVHQKRLCVRLAAPKRRVVTVRSNREEARLTQQER
jgi:hypothetical protein